MKHLILIAILALVFAPFAMAEETSSANWDNDLAPFNGARDYIAGHNHEREIELGVGVDLIVFESETTSLLPDEVTVEGRMDFANEGGSAYVVCKYNLFSRLFGE